MPAPSIDDSRLMFAFAHDLRTYLRTVLISMQLIQRSGATKLPLEDQQMLQDALTAANDINALLSAMVAFVDAKAEDGVLNLRLVLQGALMDRNKALQDAGGEVDVSSDVDVPVPLGLQTVLKELLTNSCKFRVPDRPLRIRIQTQKLPDDSIEIEVADNGPGVTPAYLEKIFTPFHRLHARDKYPGFGLGLATARRIVTGWGGSISASPRPEGGLSMRLTVPAGV